jgi:hypothetical protein
MVVGGIVVLASAALGGWLATAQGRPAFAALRQSRDQVIPGTLEYVLEPPPSGFDPVVTPARAVRVGAAATMPKDVDISLSLALVRNDLGGTGTAVGPAWVEVAHGVCFFTSKGALVSSARTGGNRNACTASNVWVQVVDATSGRTLLTTSGFDGTRSWRPSVGAT